MPSHAFNTQEILTVIKCFTNRRLIWTSLVPRSIVKNTCVNGHYSGLMKSGSKLVVIKRSTARSVRGSAVPGGSEGLNYDIGNVRPLTYGNSSQLRSVWDEIMRLLKSKQAIRCLVTPRDPCTLWSAALNRRTVRIPRIHSLLNVTRQRKYLHSQSCCRISQLKSFKSLIDRNNVVLLISVFNENFDFKTFFNAPKQCIFYIIILYYLI